MMSGVLIKQETAVAVATLLGGGLLSPSACPPFVDGIVILVTENKWLSFVFV